MGVRRFYFSSCNDICPWHATAVVVGTSLFQIIFVTANVTFLQSITTQTVDIVLAGLLMLGGVIGAQIGSNASSLLRGEQLRGLLALLVLAVCFKLFADLTLTPDDIYSIVIKDDEKNIHFSFFIFIKN